MSTSEIKDYTKTLDNWSRGQQKYPWAECDTPGKGFEVVGKTIQQVSAAAATNRYVLKGWKFSCRTIKNEDGTVKHIRVIRIS